MKHMIVPIKAEKWTEDDHWEHGCDPDSSRMRETSVPCKSESIVEVMSDCVGARVSADEIYTQDPNIYIDVKGKREPRVVEDNVALGRYRVAYDRTENKRGRVPSEEEKSAWKRGEITLKEARYEVIFEIKVVDTDEEELEWLLGIKNH